MTAATCIGHCAFRFPSDCCAVLSSRSARVTKLRGSTQVNGRSHGLRAGDADPLLSSLPAQSISAVQRLLPVTSANRRTAFCQVAATLLALMSILNGCFGSSGQ